MSSDDCPQEYAYDQNFEDEEDKDFEESAGGKGKKKKRERPESREVSSYNVEDDPEASVVDKACGKAASRWLAQRCAWGGCGDGRSWTAPTTNSRST